MWRTMGLAEAIANEANRSNAILIGEYDDNILFFC